MFERFKQVTLEREAQGKKYIITLSPIEVTALHGALVLALRHPEVQKMSGALPYLTSIRARLLELFRHMGFTEEEVQYLDTKEK